MSRSIGPNEDHKGDIRLLGAWNSDSESVLWISKDGQHFGSSEMDFGKDGGVFRLRILALDMVFPVSGILEIKFRSYFSFGISNMPKWVLEDLLDQVPLECGNGFG
ncbi:unnamed protein product [Rhizophagus irregularis]|uniref:Uncharacterized protein n=1 Tax=Rhizophagus irregularis TaxID=588596 RepID=A0A915ZRV0_9GLOM|nr:unnamed protein product [Rhizophagus irregularis]